MTRGQITLPKRYRDKLGITPETPLNVTLKNDEIVVRPLENVVIKGEPRMIKPKISRRRYLKLLKSMKGIAWTEEDDKLMRLLRKKDEERAKRLNW